MQNTYVFSDVVTNLKNTPRCHCVYIRTGTGGMAHAPLKYMSSLSLVNFLYLLTANIFF